MAIEKEKKKEEEEEEEEGEEEGKEEEVEEKEDQSHERFFQRFDDDDDDDDGKNMHDHTGRVQCGAVRSHPDPVLPKLRWSLAFALALQECFALLYGSWSWSWLR